MENRKEQLLGIIRRVQTKTAEQQRNAVPTGLLGALILDSLLARAATLARKGEYAAAESLLMQLVGGENESPRALDLLARIHAQQGRFSEAEAFWKRALEIEPNNKFYIAGLNRIAQLRSRPLWASVLLPMAAAFIAILVVFLVGFAVQNQIVHLRESLLTEVIGVKTVPESEHETKALSRVKSAPKIAIQLDGATVKTEQNKLVVLFNNGLFSYGTRLKPDAKILLSELGKQLQPHASDIFILVVGHTDDMPVSKSSVYRDNVALGMARAFTVADYLSRSTGFPMSMFDLRSVGESQPPFLNNTPEDRFRNRTVVIYIYHVENRQ